MDDDTGPDDDVNNGFDDSSLTFTMPYSLGPNTQYTFVFEVFNANMPDPEGKRGIWIREVIVNLPPNYVLAAEANQPAAPSCLHTGDGYCDHWEVNFDDGANQITWQNFGSSPGHYGDIRDQDVQTFAFLAITDDIPTNAFPWRLDGDSGDFVEGMASIGGTDDDTYVDDDTISDDDTTLSCQDAIAYFYEVCGFSMGYYSEDQVKAWCNSPSPPDWFGEAVQCIVDYYGNCDAIAECYNNIPGLAL